MPLTRAKAGGGGHVHDRSAACLEHGGDLEFHREEDAAEIDRGHLIEVIDCQLGQRHRLVAVAGVVEGGIEAAVPLERPIDQGLHVVWVGDVGGHRQCLDPRGGDFAGDRVEFGGVAGREDDGRAGGRECACGGDADTAAGAGDNRDLVFEQAGHPLPRSTRAPP
jgi:hypothetical protein